MKIKKVWVLIALFVVFVAFVGWDSYMRMTWDNHIVASAPEYFSVKQLTGKTWKVISKEEIETLPDKYKKPLEIVKKNGQYIWINNDNQVLTRNIEYTHVTENGKMVEKGYKWIVFHTMDGTAKIRIQGNNYIVRGHADGVYGCFPLSWSGNLKIEFELSDGKILATSANTYFYENLLQYLLCKL